MTKNSSNTNLEPNADLPIHQSIKTLISSYISSFNDLNSTLITMTPYLDLFDKSYIFELTNQKDEYEREVENLIQSEILQALSTITTYINESSIYLISKFNKLKNLKSSTHLFYQKIDKIKRSLDSIKHHLQKEYNPSAFNIINPTMTIELEELINFASKSHEQGPLTNSKPRRFSKILETSDVYETDAHLLSSHITEKPLEESTPSLIRLSKNPFIESNCIFESDDSSVLERSPESNPNFNAFTKIESEKYLKIIKKENLNFLANNFDINVPKKTINKPIKSSLNGFILNSNQSEKENNSSNIQNNRKLKILKYPTKDSQQSYKKSNFDSDLSPSNIYKSFQKSKVCDFKRYDSNQSFINLALSTSGILSEQKKSKYSSIKEMMTPLMDFSSFIFQNSNCKSLLLYFINNILKNQ